MFGSPLFYLDSKCEQSFTICHVISPWSYFIGNNASLSAPLILMAWFGTDLVIKLSRRYISSLLGLSQVNFDFLLISICRTKQKRLPIGLFRFMFYWPFFNICKPWEFYIFCFDIWYQNKRS
jgi:hypothetical protein